MTFHHAYNFVPAYRLDGAHFGDGRPVGHHALLDPEREAAYFHGHLDIDMTVVTALLCAETRGRDPDGHRHLQLRSRSGHSEGPTAPEDIEIPVTAVKGLLRSAFEALTASRFGVFGAHQRPESYRPAPHEAMGLVPVRVIELDGRLAAHLMLGSHDHVAAGVPDPRYAASLPDPADEHQAPYLFTPGGLDRLRAVPHGARVSARLHLIQHAGRGAYRYWLVTHLGGQRCVRGSSDSRHRWTGIELEVDGFVCRTNSVPGEPIIADKHDERIFFVQHPVPAQPISAAARASYLHVVASYLEQRKHSTHPARPSRAVAAGEPADLRPGDLAYATIESGRIVALQPVIIGRRLYQLGPANLLGDGLRPAATLDEFSPADRVFGAPGYRGHLTISPVEPVRARLGTGPRLLAELAAPKPASARFYVSSDDQGTPLPVDPPPIRSELYRSRQGLRGRKVYPHHRSDENQPELPPQARSQRRTPRNVTVHSWVAPGSSFRFRIDFTNLTAFQLGALAWLLTPAELAYPDARGALEEGYHRLGYGKPLGLGSIRLALNRDTSRLVTTDLLREAYRSLTGVRGTVGIPLPEGLVESFTTRLAAQLDVNDIQQVPFVAALRRAASGYPDHARVGYPSAPRAGSAGPVVSWFTANERIRADGERIRPRHGRTLPPLWDAGPAALPEY